MARPPRELIHALSIPTRAGALLVPSATIAEVVNVSALTNIPLGPDRGSAVGAEGLSG